MCTKQKSLPVLIPVQNTQREASAMWNSLMLNLVVRKVTAGLSKVKEVYRQASLGLRGNWLLGTCSLGTN